ncbi:glycoside hydrolase family 55 protein [Baudoinia panamericana UAMH 10762]|uniref:Glycoside hydrolase family 55 protein n=1 Tax=Baudoinia panamericana (strain UAMH 10762) TaxID=717646 RepID=M2LWJ8_BAUPA|nr:glycoside hydrolase family 55 protein [Baudoinia panamericana UAMH 10762]EMC99022.1 glycoside hydrolase family 55 protein [Baudoinia panamericana UAMH 10762]
MTTGTTGTTGTCDYWLADIKHQGIAAFNPSPDTYQVFRNVKDFGAVGDGVTDDTAAINNAISSGGRLSPAQGGATTVTPAIVYFPPGVYAISASIIDYYYTQLIGNPNCLPTIRALPNFAGGLGMIDGDQYVAGGNLGFGSTNVFWRQIRNFIIDMTLVPASSAITGIHWPTAQATSIQNVVFQMSTATGTQHQGIFIESGSGGFMNDLIFNGGLNGAVFGNQQFTMRNLTFNNAVTAIDQIWDWGWTYKSISINNCSIGLNMASGGSTAQSVGSVTFIDSQISNTVTGILTAHGPASQPPAAGSLILENVVFSNVEYAVAGANNATNLAGGSFTVAAWGEGHQYTPTGPTNFQGPITPNARPASLLQPGGKYYERSKPQYQQYGVSSFLSARDAGATGNGRTDDTAALQAAIVSARTQNKILFVDQGDYLVSSTIYIPAGSRIVGESYSVILSSGAFFNNINSPQPVVRIGNSGESGSIEWSDMIVSTQGQQQGAILFEYNLNSPSSSPSGIWDVHSRVGGFAGSNLQLAQCPTTPNTTVTSANLNQQCIAAFMTMHLTQSSSGLYLENVWLWVADHDVEDPQQRQITIYAGRGLLDQSTAGTFWLVGTAVEHHTLYQYQFANTQNVFAGQIQTETPYYQPNPSAPIPWPYQAQYSDPQFPTATVTADGLVIPDADAWGLRIVGSSTILVYGAGLYSFFNNYSTTCSNQGNGEQCQYRIFEVLNSTGISVYNLNTVGTHEMIEQDGTNLAYYGDNLDGFVDTVALYRSG